AGAQPVPRQASRPHRRGPRQRQDARGHAARLRGARRDHRPALRDHAPPHRWRPRRPRGHRPPLAPRDRLDPETGTRRMMALTPEILLLASLGAAVLGFALAVVAWRRVNRRQMVEAAELVAAGGEVTTPKGVFRALVAPLAQAMRPKSQIELDRLVTRLMNAGRRGRDETDRFLEEKVLWMLGGVVFGFGA